MVALPRVTVAAMVVVSVPVPVAEHPEAVRAADATVVSPEAHVQAGSALGSPPLISRVNWAVWPVWMVSAAGAREAVSGGGVTRRLAEAVVVAVPRVTVAAMVVVPVPVPVAEHPEAVWAADATIVSAEAHVQAVSTSGSPPVISMVKLTVWPVWTVSAAGEMEAASGGGALGAVGARVPDSEQPADTRTANTLSAVARFRCLRFLRMLTGTSSDRRSFPRMAKRIMNVPTLSRTCVGQGHTHEIVTRHGGHSYSLDGPQAGMATRHQTRRRQGRPLRCGEPVKDAVIGGSKGNRNLDVGLPPNPRSGRWQFADLRHVDVKGDRHPIVHG